LAEVEYAKSLDCRLLIPQDADEGSLSDVKIIVQNPPYNCGCYGRSLCCPSDFIEFPPFRNVKERNEDKDILVVIPFMVVFLLLFIPPHCGSVYVQYSSGYGLGW